MINHYLPLFLSIVALIISSLSYRSNKKYNHLGRKSTVVDNHLSLYHVTSHAQDEYRHHQDKDDEFYYFCKLLSVLETVCLLHNKDYMPKDVKDSFTPYLIELFNSYGNNKVETEMVRKAKSSDDALIEIQHFCEKHQVKNILKIILEARP